MGSGKTFLGKQLAEKLGAKFVDIDDIIIQNLKKSITEIFEQEGETYFRNHERKALLDAAQNYDGVIATGGGTPCFQDNMEIIKKSGISIYIKMSPESLTKRLENIRDSRPLLKSKNSDELYWFISETLKRREPFYMKADHVIKGEEACVDDLLKLLPK